MPEEPEGPRSKSPKGPGTAGPRPGLFILKGAGLLALTAGFYWIGWRSPLARADQAVRVEIADPPPAAPVLPPVVAPSGAVSEPDSSRKTQIEDASRSPEASASRRDDEQQDEPTTHRRRTRRHRASADRSDRD